MTSTFRLEAFLLAGLRPNTTCCVSLSLFLPSFSLSLLFFYPARSDSLLNALASRGTQQGPVVYLNGYWVARPAVSRPNKPKLTQSHASPGCSDATKKRPRPERVDILSRRPDRRASKTASGILGILLVRPVCRRPARRRVVVSPLSLSSPLARVVMEVIRPR